MAYEGPQLPREALSDRSRMLLAELERRGEVSFAASNPRLREQLSFRLSERQMASAMRELVAAGWLIRKQAYGYSEYSLPHLQQVSG